MPLGAPSVEVYDACGLSEGCELELCGHPSAIAKTDVILEAQGIKSGICAALLVKRLAHAGQPEGNAPLGSEGAARVGVAHRHANTHTGPCRAPVDVGAVGAVLIGQAASQTVLIRLCPGGEKLPS